MIFSSVFFIFVFLPVVLAIYYVVPFKYQLKNLVLLLASLVFYAWGEPVYVILMLLSISINYVGGIELESYLQSGRERNAKVACIGIVAVNLAVLGFYKYYGFVLENINLILPFKIPYHELALPIGISFYTFQTLSYIIDVYRGKVKAQHNPITFGAYVCMFPQLIAGPIVRYSDVEKQLMSRTLSWEKFGDGAMWFLRGLGKKVLLANNMGSVFDAIMALGASNTSVLTAWIGCFAYTMQIYFDFGGYSDMAIGLGKMLGFDFVKNFDYPYTAKSITEFWRRWHISLSSWFKEYVYIPLGGNRGGTKKAVRNLLIVWCLTGLWHGAAWNFIFWGLYYGIILCVEKYILKEKLEKLPAVFQHVYTMLLVMLGWVLFSAPSLGRAFSYTGTMLGIGGSGVVDATGLYFLSTSFVIGIIAAILCTPLVYKRIPKITRAREGYRQVAGAVIYIAIFLVSTAYLVNATYNPFLYFRF